MKNKKGFTLAEVLITLAIIGVVAAIVAPALNTAVQKNKVGPTLSKFVSTIENANEHILADSEDNIFSLSVSSGEDYVRRLSRFVNGSVLSSNASSYTFADATGNAYEFGAHPVFKFGKDETLSISYGAPANNANADSSYRGQVATILYDTNGFDNRPNKLGKDLFIFLMDNNGSIIPKGGKQESEAYTAGEEPEGGGEESEGTSAGAYAWQGTCDATTLTDGVNCSGSIADNGWKVIYKY